MWNWLRERGKVPVKLGLVVVLLLLPLAVLVYHLLRTSNESIEFAQKERQGVRFLQPLRSLLVHAGVHRGLSDAVLSGDLLQAEALRSAQREVEADLVALAAADAALGDELGTKAQLVAINRTWKEIRDQVNGAGIDAPTSFARHSQLVDQLGELIRHVADTSNLILDPFLDTYYLMDAAVARLPETIDSVGRLQALGHGVALRQQVTPGERFAMGQMIASAEAGGAAIERGMRVAFGRNPLLRPRLEADVTAALAGVDNFRSGVEQQFLGASDLLTVAPADHSAAGTAAIAGLVTLYERVMQQLDRQLAARVDLMIFERNRGLILVATLIGIGLLSVFAVSRGITLQTAAVSQTFSQLGMGNFDARATVLTGDELGTLAQSLNSMLDSTRNLMQSQEERDAIQRSIQKLLDEVSAVAEGDLRSRAEVTADVTGAIADSFNFMIEELQGLVAGVQETTLHVSSAAGEVQATAEHLAQGSESQVEQITDTSAAIEEMAASIQQVSDNAAAAATVAQQSLQNAKEGAGAVSKTIAGMTSIRGQVQETAKRIKRLGEGSQEIGEIVELIGDIADRTSILALNASIQAAMAGEAGRGFAVVAEEVERLAERSAEATKSIGALVKTIQSETIEAVAAMEETTREVVGGSSVALEAGAALESIELVSRQLADLIQSIALASKQQARGSESLARSMSEISEVTGQTAAGTKQAAISIHNLATLADHLRESVSRFRLPAKAA